jgi:regulator of sirC expression with transglutaminase-like and TPR domain
MLTRMLRNLKTIYLNVREDDRALAAVERLLVLWPDAPEEHRARGLLLLRLGRDGEAASELESYLALAPDAPDASRVRVLLRRLQRGESVDFGQDLLEEGDR